MNKDKILDQLFEEISILDEFYNFYLNYEWWHKRIINRYEFDKTINMLFLKDRIIHCEKDGELLGYIESYRVNHEQLGRLVCNCNFDVGLENIEDGDICYVANVVIHPSYEKGWVAKNLRQAFFKQNKYASFIIETANRKSPKHVKVFDRTKILRRNS